MEAHWPDGEEHSDSALGSLPEELCKQILGHLEHSDLASLAQVSRASRQQAEDEDLWQLLYMRRRWTGPERLSRNADESWKNAFRRRARIEKHGSGATFGRESGEICFMRDGCLVRTIAAKEHKGVKRKGPAVGTGHIDNLYAAANRSAIAHAIHQSLSNQGLGAAAGHLSRSSADSFTLAMAERSFNVQNSDQQEGTTGIFDRLLSISVDLHSAIRHAQAA